MHIIDLNEGNPVMKIANFRAAVLGHIWTRILDPCRTVYTCGSYHTTSTIMYNSYWRGQGLNTESTINPPSLWYKSVRLGAYMYMYLRAVLWDGTWFRSIPPPSVDPSLHNTNCLSLCFPWEILDCGRSLSKSPLTDNITLSGWGKKLKLCFCYYGPTHMD
jgi:hypothetical protein